MVNYACGNKIYRIGRCNNKIIPHANCIYILFLESYFVSMGFSRYRGYILGNHILNCK